MTLTARDVQWSAGGRLIVDRVNLTAGNGRTIGLLGPNGSGKSSLLRLLAGMRRADQGKVLLDETALAAVGRRTIARRVAVVEQEVSTDQDPTVRDVIDLGRIPFRRAWAAPVAADEDAVLRAAEVTDLTGQLDRRYRTLSGGERQRVQIARALAQEPSELLLDEPTNHLDVHHQLALLELVSSLAVTSVLALHDLNLAATFCDEVVVLQRGRVVAAGSPQTVLTEALVNEVYNVRCRISHDEWGLNVRFLAEGR